MTIKAIMIQGTTSNAGKSLVVAGLCRILARSGFAVAPFKPQNMALNSAVTIDGGEIGRAQALQAEAAGVKAHSDMNPILLKPSSETGSQIILQGRVIDNMNASDYHHFKPQLMPKILESYSRLADRYEWIIIEGAGSPAEINLRDGDLANMGFAEQINCPVLIVSDIDRGGVFAHLFGTMGVLSKSDQELIAGFIINKFRGAIDLLTPGIAWLEKEAARPVFGVIPYIKNLQLDAEDSLSRATSSAPFYTGRQPLKITVPLLAHLSNDTDFNPLLAHPDIELSFVREGQKLPACDLIVLPGSKNVQADLSQIIAQQWHRDIYQHLRYGGKLIGICGGFQMLGKRLHDPYGIESASGSTDGLGLLEIETTLQKHKILGERQGTLFTGPSDIVKGYEIHMGTSKGPALDLPSIKFDHGQDGAVSSDDQIMGTYLHGIFDYPPALKALVKWAGLPAPRNYDYQAERKAQLNHLADIIEASLDLQAILELPEKTYFG